MDIALDLIKNYRGYYSGVTAVIGNTATAIDPYNSGVKSKTGSTSPYYVISGTKCYFFGNLWIMVNDGSSSKTPTTADLDVMLWIPNIGGSGSGTVLKHFVVGTDYRGFYQKYEIPLCQQVTISGTGTFSDLRGVFEGFKVTYA